MDADRTPLGRLFRKTAGMLKKRKKYVSIEVVDIETMRRRYGEDAGGYGVEKKKGEDNR